MKKKQIESVYVQSIVVPVPRKNLSRYKKWVNTIGPIWKENGALEVMDCIGDHVEKGDNTSYPRSVKLKSGEVVCIGWVTFKTKAQFKKAMDRVMDDPRLAEFMNPDDLFFDGMRFFWGGFKTLARF